MSKTRIILINIIGMVVVVGLIAAGAFIFYENKNYVQTDDAVVSADIHQVIAPASGILTNWDGKEGATVSSNEELGKISNGSQGMSIDSLVAGTIIKNEAKSNQMVQAGQVLAQTADMSNLYITANIDENDLKKIEVGDSVDITVDGDSGTVFNGKVQEIGYN